MLTPLPSGTVEWLTGNNVAYRREVLDRFWSVIQEDRWEDRLHSAIRKGGVWLTLCPDIKVAHKMNYRSPVEYAGQRYLYSRGFAGMRLRGSGPLRKLLYGAGACVLPPILLARIIRNGWADPASRVHPAFRASPAGRFRGRQG